MQVRTPLNGCLASAEMLLETPLGAEQRELAKTIRVSGSILLSTVSNFLDFFKMEAGKQLDVVRTEMDVEARLCRSIRVRVIRALTEVHDVVAHLADVATNISPCSSGRCCNSSRSNRSMSSTGLG